MKVGVVGLGLIGGSLARQIMRNTEHTVLAYDISDEVLKKGALLNAYHEILDINAPVIDVDILLIATNPRATLKILDSIVPRIKSGAIIMDCAGIKKDVIKKMESLKKTREDVFFVGGHPMAGSEGSGYSSAEEGLFKNARWVLSVPENCAVPGNMLAMLTKLIRTLGAEAILMDAVEHDRRVAMISHLPHVAAFALSEIVANTNDTAMKQLIGGGFKDTTRIAASSPSLWTDIFSESSELIPSLEQYIKYLEEYLALLKHSELQGIKARLITAAEFRRSIPEGLRAKSHLDIEGEAK